MAEEKENFLESLGDDFKDIEELKNFNSVQDLAKSYVSQSKAFSGKLDSVSDDEDWDSFKEKSSKFFKIPEKEEDYKVDVEDNSEDLKKLGFKYKIHPKQVKGFIEDFKEVQSKTAKNLKEDDMKEFEKANEENFKGINNKDEMIAKAINNAGLSLEDFKKELGHLYNSPKVQNLLYKSGKALAGSPSKSESEPADTTSKDGPEIGDDKAMEAKLRMVKDYMNEDPRKGAYYDSSHPKHRQVTNKVDEACKALAAWSEKTGKSIDLLN